MSGTYYIYDNTGWLSAVSASVSNTYNTYFLMSDITFTSTNKFYLNSGTSDTADYLRIREGQTFDGNGHTITIQSGSQPTSGLSGILRSKGTTTNSRATIQNVKVYVDTGVTYYNGNYGTAINGQLGGLGNPNYIYCKNIIVYSLGSLYNNINNVRFISLTSDYSVFYNCFVYFQNVASSTNYACGCFGSAGATEITNLVVIDPTTNAACQYYAIGYSDWGNTVTNAYFYMLNNSNTSGRYYFYNERRGSQSSSMTNVYMIFGTYSSLWSTGTQKYLLYSATGATGGSVTFTNVYTNYDRASSASSNFVENPGATVTYVLSNCNNQYTDWSNSPPTFSGSGFNPSIVPYRISSFLDYPFNSNLYQTAYELAGFADMPCLCKGMSILTPTGYRLIETLKKGDYVLSPPDNRFVQIVQVYKTTVTGNKENTPFRIPTGFFDKDTPSDDAYFYNKWILPTSTPDIKDTDELIGKEIEYYHIKLPDYYNDKLICNNLIVDSWDDRNPHPI